MTVVEPTKIKLEVQQNHGDAYARQDEVEFTNPLRAVRYLMEKCDRALKQADDEAIEWMEGMDLDRWE